MMATRSARAGLGREQQRQALEAIVGASAGPARLVLSSSGRVIWASPACERLLDSALRALPDGLRGAARRLIDAAAGQIDLPASLRLSLRSGAIPIAAHLSVLRTASGAPLALVELEDIPAGGQAADELARRFHLTRAEGVVLGQLAEGLSNSAIAARLHVSVEAVRTHVRRILSKLGLSSRVQAALLAARRG
jgi:DNA-binding CsgD family transcriptional regulator